jgi:hypothetical protein
MISSLGSRAPRLLKAAFVLALAAACDAPPPQGTGDVAPDTTSVATPAAAPSHDSLAPLESAQIADADNGARNTAGGRVTRRLGPLTLAARG